MLLVSQMYADRSGRNASAVAASTHSSILRCCLRTSSMRMFLGLERSRTAAAVLQSVPGVLLVPSGTELLLSARTVKITFVCVSAQLLAAPAAHRGV